MNNKLRPGEIERVIVEANLTQGQAIQLRREVADRQSRGELLTSADLRDLAARTAG